MDCRNTLQKHFEVIIGKQFTDLHLACEMMMFTFGEYALHTQCLTRIIHENDILVTTLDYQNWDGEVDTNNDEWKTQQLSHIECHTHLEIYLTLLEELDEEAREEDANHRNTKEQTWSAAT